MSSGSTVSAIGGAVDELPGTRFGVIGVRSDSVLLRPSSGLKGCSDGGCGTAGGTKGRNRDPSEGCMPCLGRFGSSSGRSFPFGVVPASMSMLLFRGTCGTSEGDGDGDVGGIGIVIRLREIDGCCDGGLGGDGGG